MSTFGSMMLIGLPPRSVDRLCDLPRRSHGGGYRSGHRRRGTSPPPSPCCQGSMIVCDSRRCALVDLSERQRSLTSPTNGISRSSELLKYEDESYKVVYAGRCPDMMEKTRFRRVSTSSVGRRCKHLKGHTGSFQCIKQTFQFPTNRRKV